jgi:hypothetical protein
MRQQPFAGRRSLSRRGFLVMGSAVLSVGGLLAACQSPSPSSSAPPAQPTAAPVTTDASPLKGIKLTIIGGNSYVARTLRPAFLMPVLHMAYGRLLQNDSD